MSAPDRIQYALSRLQPQVICIVQTKLATRILELFWCEALERGLRRDRHENREFDRAMREM